MENTNVKIMGNHLFKPDWGTYDLACGGEIISVFGGPADWNKYYKKSLKSKKKRYINLLTSLQKTLSLTNYITKSSNLKRTTPQVKSIYAYSMSYIIIIQMTGFSAWKSMKLL